VTTRTTDALTYRDSDHWLIVEPWGPDSVRVRAGRTAEVLTVPGALLDRPAEPEGVQVETTSRGSAMVNGSLRVELSPEGLLRFLRAGDGEELLAEMPGHFAWPGPRQFSAMGEGYYRLEQRFKAYRDEQIFGMGQRQHGRLDQKGMVLELVQRNGEVSIPFMVSSRGYGLLWNLPAVGRAEFAANGTRWVADAARQIDYWVSAGNPSEVLHRYADATGRAPDFPEWATGLWQSKLRYEGQERLLEVAREYARRGLPLSVIVVDYYHWTYLGDWQFDPLEWPDPKAMVSELADLGVKVMVSVWPSVSPLSDNHGEMRDAGLFVGSQQGLPAHHLFPDKGFSRQAMAVSFYDATSAEARDYVWQQVKTHYYDLGVRIWWLDGCEPEMYPEQFANLSFAAGNGREVANLYPREHVRGFYEHMRDEGETEIISLVRSAWAGSQRYGAALWSGDIGTTFEALTAQVAGGLSVAMSGIPWWTTDIGGFHGGDPTSPDYRELVVRWFQYAVFCPILRMHGHREPRGHFNAGHSGGPNELWSFGDEAYEILVAQLGLRGRLHDYLMGLMREASRVGLPPMRPLFLEFPSDLRAWHVEDQFMLGPDLLIAPVLTLGARDRRVYLPGGRDVVWVDIATGESYEGGRTVAVDAPLERIPVFARHGCALTGLYTA
jgi:alpha-D-xyloside xylohydrolase